MELEVGQKVLGEYIYESKKITYTGVVHSIKGNFAEIDRDDKISSYTGYWCVVKKLNGSWGAGITGSDGTLSIIPKLSELDKSQDLKVGDRVRGIGTVTLAASMASIPSRSATDNYTGTVFSILGSDKATIKRDDGKKGYDGEMIPGYGPGWVVLRKKDGTWGSDEVRGTLIKIYDEGSLELKIKVGDLVKQKIGCIFGDYDLIGRVFSINGEVATIKKDDGEEPDIIYGYEWTALIPELEKIPAPSTSPELKVWDRVIGSYEGKSYTGHVASIDYSKNEAYITKDATLESVCVKKKPDGWGAYGVEGILTIMPKESSNFIIKEEKQSTNLKVGDRVTGYSSCGKISYTGIVDSIDNVENEAHITRDDKWRLNKWVVDKKPDGSWGSNGLLGTLKIMPKESPLIITATQENSAQLQRYKDLEVGDRVRGIYEDDPEFNYTGTVFSCSTKVVNIKRDDGKTGSGDHIPGYGKGWRVKKKDDCTWGASGTAGKLEIIPKESPSICDPRMYGYFVTPGSSSFGWDVKVRSDGMYEISKSSKNKQISKTLTGGIMNDLRSKFSMMLTKEPNKSFRKAGITDTNDMLSEEGKNIFLSWLLHSKYADDFKKDVVDELLKDEKK